MKVLAALLLSAITAIAFAGDRAIYDLMYLPKAGTFFGSTEAGHGYGKATLNEKTQGDIADLEISGYALQQVIGFSLVDNLFLSASMNYQNSDTELDVTGADKDTYTYVGLSDPTITARYRVIDSEYLFDVLAAVELSTGDAKAATADKDGNNKKGGNVLNVAVEFGKKTTDFQFAVQLGATRNFEATEKSNGIKTKANAHSAYNLRGSMLQSLTENTFINPFAELTFTNAYNEDDGTQNKQTSQIDLGAEYQYLVSQNLLLKAGVKYTNEENKVSDTTETREDYLFTYLIGANYQF